jgi:hypothetical protein
MIGQILHGGEWNVDHLEPGVRHGDIERSEPIDGLLEQAPRLIIFRLRFRERVRPSNRS